MIDILGLWGKTVKDAVGRYARNQSAEDKEDIEQECLLRLCEIQDALEVMFGELGLKATQNYVYGVCHHKILNLIRDKKKYLNHLNLSEISWLLESYPAQKVSDSDIDESIKRLSVEEQRVVREIYFLGKTEKDVAEYFGKTLNWVRKVKNQALGHLKETL